MAHGIQDKNRDFVKAGVSTETDWHKLTVSTGKPLQAADFPEMEGRELQFMAEDGFKPLSIGGNVWRVPVTADDGLPCGKPYGESFTLFTPRQGFELVESILGGTDYEIERIGLLWNRSKWFISAYLRELATLAPKGEKFQLNFSGGIDGSMSPQCELSHIRAVCWNTISLSRLQGEILFKRKLTKGFESALDCAKPEIEKAVGMARLFREAMGKAEGKACHVQAAREIYAGAIGEKAEKLTTTARNTVDGLTALFQRGDGNNGRTLADVVNGFTQFGTRGFETTRKDTFTRIESSEFGGMADRKAEFVKGIFADDGAKFQAKGAQLLAVN
jgi:hypothetical protein